MSARAGVFPKGAGALVLTALLLLIATSCAPIPAQEPAESAGPKTLQLAMNEPLSIDPGLADGSSALTVVNLLFEPLLRVARDGSLQPAAAESWQILGDGRTVLFQIRGGLKWLSGQSLTSRDFAYGWIRNLDATLGADYAYLLYPIAGAQQFAEGGDGNPENVGIQAPSPTELRVTLNEPSTSFLARVAHWAFMPLPRPAINDFGQRWTEADRIDSNGPYRLAEWFHGESMKLVPNPEYWDRSKPRFDEIGIKFVPRDESLLPAFRNQAADLVEVSGGDLAAVRASAELRARTAVFDLAGNWFLVFNAKKQPWSDPRVRNAFSLAIDRNEMVGRVFDGAELPAERLVPPGAARGQPAEPLTPDAAAERAKSLLADAGFPGGSGFPTTRFTYHRTDQWDRLAAHLIARWEEILGVKVEADVREWRDYLDFSEAPGDFDLYRAGWNSEYLDPQNWYNTLWWSGDDFLRSGWHNTEFDALVERADKLDDQAVRSETYAGAAAILDAELPGLPLANRAVAYLVQPYVSGLWVSPLGGYLVIDELEVTRPQR